MFFHVCLEVIVDKQRCLYRQIMKKTFYLTVEEMYNAVYSKFNVIFEICLMLLISGIFFGIYWFYIDIEKYRVCDFSQVNPTTRLILTIVLIKHHLETFVIFRWSSMTIIYGSFTILFSIMAAAVFYISGNQFIVYFKQITINNWINLLNPMINEKLAYYVYYVVSASFSLLIFFCAFICPPLCWCWIFKVFKNIYWRIGILSLFFLLLSFLFIGVGQNMIVIFTLPNLPWDYWITNILRASVPFIGKELLQGG